MIIKIPQPVRDTFTIIAILFLCASGAVAFVKYDVEMIFYWCMEVALVCSILGECYAVDYKQDTEL